MRETYQGLADAIVLQAVKDYRKVLKYLKERPRNMQAKIGKAEIEQFFYSKWFSTLTQIDPNTLITKLEEELQ